MSEPTEPLSPRRNARREKILAAAEAIFIEDGFKTATMEGLANAAGISKVTIYSYFKDKEEVFEAVCVQVADRLGDAVVSRLNQREPIARAVIQALTAKHEMVWYLVRQSRFSSELFASKNKFGRQVFRNLDEYIESSLELALKRAKVPQSRAKARLLFGGANGISNRAESITQMRADLKFFAEAVLAETNSSPLGRPCASMLN